MGIIRCHECGKIVGYAIRLAHVKKPGFTCHRCFVQFVHHVPPDEEVTEMLREMKTTRRES